MRQTIEQLVRELALFMPALATSKEYGSLREYTEFLSRVLTGFGEFLLSEREALNEQETILLREMLDNPLLRPVEEVRQAAEKYFGYRG